MFGKLFDAFNDKCPNCNAVLNQRPKRKGKCKACGKYIFALNAPWKGKKQTELVAENAEKEHSIKIAQFYRGQEIQDIKSRLSDAQWKYAHKDNWGNYRDTLRYVAELYADLGESKEYGFVPTGFENQDRQEAVNLYLQLCFLDLNGPGDAEMEEKPFKVSSGALDEDELGYLRKLIAIEKMDAGQIQAMFMKVELPFNPKTPRSKEQCWPKLAKALGL